MAISHDEYNLTPFFTWNLLETDEPNRTVHVWLSKYISDFKMRGQIPLSIRSGNNLFHEAKSNALDRSIAHE